MIRTNLCLFFLSVILATGAHPILAVTIINNSAAEYGIIIQDQPEKSPLFMGTISADHLLSFELTTEYSTLYATLSSPDGIVFTTQLCRAAYEASAIIDNNDVILIDKPTADDPIVIKLLGSRIRAVSSIKKLLDLYTETAQAQP